MIKKQKHIILYFISFVAISIAWVDPCYSQCPDNCLEHYVENLEKEGHVIKNVVLLTENSENGKECVARFMVSSPSEKKVITARLDFNDDCEMIKSTGISTVYLKRADNGKLAIKTRYLPASKVKLPESGG